MNVISFVNFEETGIYSLTIRTANLTDSFLNQIEVDIKVSRH